MFHPGQAPQLRDCRQHILHPHPDLVGIRIYVSRIATALVIEAQRWHALFRGSLGKRSDAAVGTQTLVAEGLADHQPPDCPGFSTGGRCSQANRAWSPDEKYSGSFTYSFVLICLESCCQDGSRVRLNIGVAKRCYRRPP